MIHLESLMCYSCEKRSVTTLFDEDRYRPIVGTCGHTVCFYCSKQDPNGNCPICKTTSAFTNKTVNFEVKRQMEEYRKNAFQTIHTLWDTLISDQGICSRCNPTHKETIRICSTCQQEKNLNDLVFRRHVLCEPCADRHLLEKHREKCNKTLVMDRMKEVQRIRCTNCSSDTLQPHICTECFHRSSCSINADRFAFCSHCILDHHSGHETRKASEDPDLRFDTFRTLQKLVKAKLNSLPKDKCAMRKLWLDLMGQQLILNARWLYEIDDDIRVTQRERFVEGAITILENQFRKLENIEETCHCVKVWEDVKRLAIFDWTRKPLHLVEMCLKRDPSRGFENIDDIEGCPLDWESSAELREHLMEIIEKGKRLTKPLDRIDVLRITWGR